MLILKRQSYENATDNSLNNICFYTICSYIYTTAIFQPKLIFQISK